MASVEWKKVKVTKTDGKLDSRLVDICEQAKNTGYCAKACIMMARHWLFGKRDEQAVAQWPKSSDMGKICSDAGLKSSYENDQAKLTKAFKGADQIYLLCYARQANKNGHWVIAVECSAGKTLICDPYPPAKAYLTSDPTTYKGNAGKGGLQAGILKLSDPKKGFSADQMMPGPKT